MATSSPHAEASTVRFGSVKTSGRCKRLSDEVYELYFPPKGPVNLEIVLFHGFNLEEREDAYLSTWRREEDPTCSLDSLLAEAYPQARVLAVSYDASIVKTCKKGRMDLYNVGENLAQSLIQQASVGKNCPVLLVGHGVGGLVLKALCLKADHFATSRGKHIYIQQCPYSLFLRNLRGVFFYSTAHSGSPIFHRGESEGKGLLLRCWELLDSDACRINFEFAALRLQHRWKAGGVCEANETDITTLILPPSPFTRLAEKPRTAVVTEEASARYDIDLGFFSTISGEDYYSICRPKDRHSMSFQRLDNFLKAICMEEEEQIAHQPRFLDPPRLMVDMDIRKADVIKMLKLEDEETSRLALQVVGMGGIGKSTLVKEVLKKIGGLFESVWFVEVGKRTIISALLEFLALENFYSSGRRRVMLQNVQELWLVMKRSKVLLVLDDVQTEDQVSLFLQPENFGYGSRLIVTSRIQREMPGFVKYNVPFLSQESSDELFRAQVKSQVVSAIPAKLVREIVEKCDGLPLTVEVIGSYLRNENKLAKWEGSLEKLGKAESVDGTADDKLWRKLRVSYDDLGNPEQEVFLDLASFDMCGPWERQYDLEVFRAAWRPTSCGMSVQVELENLVNRSLIRIIPRNGDEVVYIHAQLRDMGKSISRPPRTNPENCRGLWEQEDTERLLTMCKRRIGVTNSKVEVLSVGPNRRGTSSHAAISEEKGQALPWGTVHELEILRLLRMSNINMIESNHTHQRFPSSLTLLHMIHCSKRPRERWSPLDWWFNSDKWPVRDEDVGALHQLAVLLLEKCNCVRLPENIHELRNLKILRLVDWNMSRVPDKFYLLPSLERLHLECAQLEELPSSFVHIGALKTLTIRCSALKAWPTPNPLATGPQEVFHLDALTSLTLAGLPFLMGLPDSFGRMRSLETLVISECSALKTLPEGFGDLKHLKELTIRRCDNLESLCESFGNLDSLEGLFLMILYTLRMLPDSTGSLRSLKSFEMFLVPNLATFSWNIFGIGTLTKFRTECCAGLEDLGQGWGQQNSTGSQPSNLKTLFIRECPRLRYLPESLGQCRVLSQVTLSHCRDLECLPESLGELKGLALLQLEGCSSIKRLPWSTGELTALTQLSLRSCEELEVLPETVSQLTALQHLDLYPTTGASTGMTGIGDLDNAEVPASLGDLKALTSLRIHRCAVVPESLFQLTGLHRLSIFGEGFDIPDSLGKLESLHSLEIRGCHSIPMSLGRLSSLRTLNIIGHRISDKFSASLGHLQSLSESGGINVSGIPEWMRGESHLLSLPQSLGHLGSLIELTCRNLSAIPESLGQLSALRFLRIEGGMVPTSLPESLGNLGSLIELRCINVDLIPESLGLLSALESLEVKGGSHPLSLPESLGHLRSLRELKCENVSEIPESVGQLNALKSLTITGGTLAKLPESLGQLGSLTGLWVEECANISGVPVFLKRLTTLERLSISKCGMLEKVPDALHHLVKLKSLIAPDLRHFEGFPESLLPLINLNSLTISGSKTCDVKKPTFESLKRLPRLVKLTIQNAENFEGLLESLGQLPRLQSLDIRESKDEQRRFDMMLSGHFRSLQKLTFDRCENLISLSTSVSSLESVKIEDCSRFERIQISVGKLKLLRIRNCPRFIGLPDSFGRACEPLADIEHDEDGLYWCKYWR